MLTILKKKRRNKQHRGEKGQSLVIITLSMIALLAFAALGLDGAMMYWNQRRAQNGADAAVIAGVASLIEGNFDGTQLDCNFTEDAILAEVYEYAGNNEVPDASIGDNVEVYYLKKDPSGGWMDYPNLIDGSPWKLTGGGVPAGISCADIAGLRVKANFPQDTFIAGVIGLAETNVAVDAYAVWEFNNWCTDFAIYSLNDDGCNAPPVDLAPSGDVGSGVFKGGLHSNGCIKVGGSRFTLDDDPAPYPTEYNGDRAINADIYDAGGVELSDTEIDNLFEDVPPQPAPDLGFDYSYFAPGGSYWNAVDPNHRFYFETGIDSNDIPNQVSGIPATVDYYGNVWVKESDITPGKVVPKDGLYVIAAGGVTPGSIDEWWAVTFAMADVDNNIFSMSGESRMLPYTRGIFIYTEVDDGNSTEISMTGSVNWAGLILAPYGEVNLSAAGNKDIGGMILSGSLSISGARININHRPGYCPVEPPRILLTE
jgi:hypothetical protein